MQRLPFQAAQRRPHRGGEDTGIEGSKMAGGIGRAAQGEGQTDGGIFRESHRRPV